MDNRYGSGPPYPYGYPPPSQPYPPPQIPEVYPPPPPHSSEAYPPPPPHSSEVYPPPPHSSEAYPPPPHSHYPYPYSQPAYPYPYTQPAYPYPPHPYSQPSYQVPPPRPYSYSGPLPQTTAPPPSIQHSSSFQYGSSHYQYHPDSSPYPAPNAPPLLPSRSNSFSSAHGHDNVVSELPDSSGVGVGSRPSNASIYPPLDDLMSGMRLSDVRPSAPASPPAPSVPSMDSLALTTPASPGGEFGHHGSLHGIHARSPSWDSCFSCVGSPSSSSFESEGMQIVPLQKGSLKVLLLHGNLDIWVYEAKNLPNMDMFHRTLGDMFGRLPGNVSNKIEGHVSRKITSDPYVSITVSHNAVIGRTYVISNEENPVWMQHFIVPVAHYAAEVHFLVKDSDVVGSQLIGSVSIPVEQLYLGAKVEGTYPILNASGKQCKAGAVLSISIQYTPIKNLSSYHHGVGAGPDYQGVPDTYFPLRKGGTVTLYQDAHVPDGCLPEFMLDRGMKYVHGKCWQDIFDAIRQARRLVYITGWSVWHKVRLVRDGGNHSSDCSLGELLRSKSAEGVRVLLLVWDDPTSRSILGYKTDGIMATHDEETRRFFKHSSVQVLLCPRVGGKRHSWVKQREVSTIYTHHQKTVIVDADAGNNRRKIISFVGGLDLCDGRYDTPVHPLFRTQDTVHKDDYHNPSFQGNTTGCPREPWHDLHCKIDGPAAYDILTNFQQRWLKASKAHGIKKLKMPSDDSLLLIDRLPDIVGISDVPCLSEHDPESWHVQVFRSIDSSSVKAFPKNPKEATSMNLVCGKNVLIDMSIHTAYVKAIRAAQHYIYIENQYFIGSSYNWSSYRELGANNLIPMEIALKIAEKIKAHERFAAYIVVPMWPEGVPTGAATQRILFWQNKTMQMMYETIYKALVEVGLEEAYTPLDYLNFFCLGNREAPDGSPASAGGPHPPNSPQAMCQKSRRFMIYVHSKGMIVDDEYVILGSANINQRSMEGTRDTEIAMGAYQPHYTWAKKSAHPFGQIYGYRMSLWAEHLGLVDDCFTEPETIECVRKVRGLGEMNWRQFAAPEATEMRGHLLKYPVEVDRRGKVKSLPGCENFPDLGGNICGSFIGIQENLTI
ncbi:phospholipase D gamma 1-like isoform X1 [Chenopodium quinoa]|uniref:phospholipase D gamma 1-like isoform X1 n=1 Tax=Chenopodium quinoa TaxID=63459 RepID=UPI000B7917EA|nr:phospholipase D gamma 1-like isoform X1 [Chenopodium quinoa]